MVVDDVLVNGLCLIPSGASAVAVVTEAEPRKRMGHGGKLSIGVNSVRLADNEKAVARSFQENAALAHGKEAVFAQGTEITAYIDGDIYLKRASFQPPKSAPNPTPAAPNPPQPHRL